MTVIARICNSCDANFAWCSCVTERDRLPDASHGCVPRKAWRPSRGPSTSIVTRLYRRPSSLRLQAMANDEDGARQTKLPGARFCTPCTSSCVVDLPCRHEIDLPSEPRTIWTVSKHSGICMLCRRSDANRVFARIGRRWICRRLALYCSAGLRTPPWGAALQTCKPGLISGTLLHTSSNMC